MGNEQNSNLIHWADVMADKKNKKKGLPQFWATLMLKLTLRN